MEKVRFYWWLMRMGNIYINDKDVMVKALSKIE